MMVAKNGSYPVICLNPPDIMVPLMLFVGVIWVIMVHIIYLSDEGLSFVSIGMPLVDTF